MDTGTTYAAIDLGASSGRVVAGTLDGERIRLARTHRIANQPVSLPDGLHWDVVGLFAASIRTLAGLGELRSVGVDSWGVDYGLLDRAGRLLGLPYHYRDSRTAGMAARAFERVPAETLYAATGIQTLPFNTVFQLLADQGGAALAGADRVALIPDLFNHWLTGTLVAERTAASTTGLLGARDGEWATPLIERLGLAPSLFGPLVEPGADLGPSRSALGLDATTVRAVAGHDTASAFVAAPLQDRHSAVLSSGTWSLLGLELPAPVLDETARAFNLTNERGVDGTTRLLRNVTGLWLEQECARTYRCSHAELFRMAAKPAGEVPLFDPDSDEFLAPGNMPNRIADACERSGQARPRGRGATVRSILLSLACKYRWVLERLERVGGVEVRRIHVVGGGARAELLCRLTADITRREVVAGPVEATALGNLLVQARADGELGSLAEMRAVVAASIRCDVYEPTRDAHSAAATYERFLHVTGLAEPAHA